MEHEQRSQPWINSRLLKGKAISGPTASHLCISSKRVTAPDKRQNMAKCKEGTWISPKCFCHCGIIELVWSKAHNDSVCIPAIVCNAFHNALEILLGGFLQEQQWLQLLLFDQTTSSSEWSKYLQLSTQEWKGVSILEENNSEDHFFEDITPLHTSRPSIYSLWKAMGKIKQQFYEKKF